jgi:hypothetical protein
MASQLSRGTTSETTSKSWENTAHDQESNFETSQSGGADKGLMSKASETLLDTAEQQKAAGANLISDMAGSVRRAAGEFDSQVPQVADYIRYAADQLESVSEAARRRDVGQIVSELQSFARQQPTAFLGATFLAGFAAVRFLKSSSNGAASSTAAMRPARPPAGMARYGNTVRESQDSPASPSDL